jgi:hypothetical protein
LRERAGERVLLLAACLALAACAHSPQPHYYLLAATPASSAAHTTAITLGVGPTRIAAHLDRAQIVTRPSAHRLDLIPGERWAEPLADNITRVLADNLTSRITGLSVRIYPWRGAQTPDCALTLDIGEFSLGQDGAAHLDAQWRLTDHTGKALHGARVQITQPVVGAGTETLVAAHSALLAQLADRIAQTLPAHTGRCMPREQ